MNRNVPTVSSGEDFNPEDWQIDEINPPDSPAEVEFAGGSIIEEEMVIETNHLRLQIPENVYIHHDLVDNINRVTAVMEEVSGLKFAGNSAYSMDPYETIIEKPTDTESEVGPAYANYESIVISSGDLLDMYALIHETSHALQYNQSPWFYCTWAMEGISTYTTYKTQKYIEEKCPDLVSFVGTANTSLRNVEITNFKALYAQPMEYWMDYEFTYSGNGNYAIGFALAWYLDEVYGDYTRWITEYEKSNPFHLTESYSPNRNNWDTNLSKEEQLKAFKMAYGEDVLDNFYPWLKENESIFAYQTVDLRGAEKIQLFPKYIFHGIIYNLDTGNYITDILYRDLIIDFSAGKQYMAEYKNTDPTGLVLILDAPEGVVAELYDAEGNYLRTKGIEKVPDGYAADVFIPLDDVGFIRLVGEGRMRSPKVEIPEQDN